MNKEERHRLNRLFLESTKMHKGVMAFMISIGISSLLVFVVGVGVDNDGYICDVNVRAYTAQDPANADGRTATNAIIADWQYSVAVSWDIEEAIGGLTNTGKIHIPDYNNKGELSMPNDRSVVGSMSRLETTNSIEVLMTGANAKARAIEWGVKRGKLYRLSTEIGDIFAVEWSK